MAFYFYNGGTLDDIIYYREKKIAQLQVDILEKKIELMQNMNKNSIKENHEQ
jgi:hypothetical protein